ncbi:MAG: zinc ribbon domain-containing protein, partial [Muribaculaceae bacterium]|nr:zinc ribbon domain-containing protein [Muribaculaceae bacterium]
MVKCKHCGHTLPEGSKFCNQCGTKVVTENSTIECPNCNSTIPAGSIFCPECGQKIAAQKEVPVKEISFDKETPEEEQQAPVTPKPSKAEAAVLPAAVS